MSSLAYGSVAAPAYRLSDGLTARQRLLAWSAVIGLHLAVIGGLAVGKIRGSEPELEPTLMVSFVSEPTPQTSAVAAPPQPVQPQPPQPQQQAAPALQPPTPMPKLVASSRSDSAMNAAPAEAPVTQASAPAAPPAPPPPLVASPSPAAQPSSAPASYTPPFAAAYLRNPPAKYPVSSRSRKEEGVVRLRVRVNAEGSPQDVLLQRSSGFDALDQAAIEVVRSKWKFVPAKRDGRPVPGEVVFGLSFSLKTQ